MPSHHDIILKWANDNVDSGILCHEIIAHTPYSTVIKIYAHDGDVFYLKQTPPALFVEALNLEHMHAHYKLSFIPQILKSNAQLNAFITSDCGGEPLREYFKNGFDPHLMAKAIAQYQDFQDQTARNFDQFIKLGASDWRLSNFPKLYLDLLADETVMTLCNFNEKQRVILEQSLVEVEEIVEILAQYNLPQRVNHSDFHDGNVVINHQTRDLFIIDWGEINIAPAILSHFCSLYNISSRYALKDDKVAHHIIMEQILKPYNGQKLPLEMIERLANIYYAFSIQNVVHASKASDAVWGKRIRFALDVFLGL